MGALTLKNFSDELRSWEFTEQKGFDPTDSSAADLTFSVKKNQIFLAEPFTATTPWISDRGRLFFENFFKENHYAFSTIDNNKKLEWLKIFNQVIETFYFVNLLNFKNYNGKICLVFDNVCSKELKFLFALESMFSFIDLRRSNKKQSSADTELSFQLSKLTTKPLIEFSSAVVLLGLDARNENYCFNLNIKHRVSKGKFNVFSFGPKVDSVFIQKNLGSSLLKKLNWVKGTSKDCQLFFKKQNLLLVSSDHIYEKKSLQKFIKNLSSLNLFAFKNPFNTCVVSKDLTSLSESSLKHTTNFDSTLFFKSSCLIFINSDLFKNNCCKNLVEFYFLKQTQFPSKTLVISQNPTNRGLDFFKNFRLEKLHKKKTFFYFYLPNKLFFEEKKEFTNNLGMSKKLIKTINFSTNSKSNLQILNKIKNVFDRRSILTTKKDMHLIFQGFVNEKKANLFLRYLFLGSKLLTSMDFFYASNSKSFFLSEQFSLTKLTFLKLYNFKIKYWLDDFFTLNFQEKFGPLSSTLLRCSKVLRKNCLNFF